MPAGMWLLASTGMPMPRFTAEGRAGQVGHTSKGMPSSPHYSIIKCLAKRSCLITHNMQLLPLRERTQAMIKVMYMLIDMY